MIDISNLGVGDILVGQKYGIEWKVAGTISDIETGGRVGVLVNDGREGSIRTDAFDQDDLSAFQKKQTETPTARDSSRLYAEEDIKNVSISKQSGEKYRNQQ